MDTAQKTKLSIAQNTEHQKKYGVAMPKRLAALIESGEVFRYDGKCLTNHTKIPGWEYESLRLRAAVPSWMYQGRHGNIDHSISGPEGEWEGAKHCVPLFHVEQSRYIVAMIDDPKCPVGFYDEESHYVVDDGFTHGVFMLSESLDAFLAKLVDMEKPDCETGEALAPWTDGEEDEEDDE